MRPTDLGTYADRSCPPSNRLEISMVTRSWLASALVGVLVLSTACTGELTTAAPPPILPLRTLRLYETGVGYFERTGTINPGGVTSLPVPSGHLDDALKTLVVLGAAGQSRV